MEKPGKVIKKPTVGVSWVSRFAMESGSSRGEMN